MCGYSIMDVIPEWLTDVSAYLWENFGIGIIVAVFGALIVLVITKKMQPHRQKDKKTEKANKGSTGEPVESKSGLPIHIDNVEGNVVINQPKAENT